MKNKKLILVSLCLLLVSLINTNIGFSQEVMYVGGRMEVTTYPDSWISDRLVQGEGKYIGFPLANYSASEIVRACKLFIVSGLGVESVVWEEVVTIPAWDFIEIVISGCDNLVGTGPGDYQLLLLTEHSNNLNDVNINSILVPVVDGGSGAQNPHPIEIYDYGTINAGCTEYYLDFISPTSSTTWTPGETYEIKWEGNVDNHVSFVSINLHEGGGASHSVVYQTENDGSFFYTVPTNISGNSNYYLTLYSNDGPYINVNSASFTIEETGTAIMQVTNLTIPSDFQKGADVTIMADVYNIGNDDFNGDLFMSWHDANGNYLTDLDSYLSTIGPGDYVSLIFYSSAIQSDVGDYFVVIKYYNPVTNQYVSLMEQAVHVRGMTVDGVDLSDANGNPQVIYGFADIVTPGSIEDVSLRSFIVVENTVTNEINIEEMLENKKGDVGKNSYSFDLDHSFVEGEYEVSYVAFYDWNAKKTKNKAVIKSITDLPWYCFWGLSALFTISEAEPDFSLIDLTNYTTQEHPIANYNEFVFTLAIEKDLGVSLEDMLVQMRFYNTISGEIVVEEMYYVEAVGLWFLEKEFTGVGDYDYRFLLNYNETEYSYPSPGYSALTIEVLPYFDILPMNEVGVVDETQFLFYTQVYGNYPEDAEVILHMRNPDYSYHDVELNNSTNQTEYFYWIGSFSVAGYYEYYYETRAISGHVFYSDTSSFFVGFGNNCDNIQLPGMVDRDLWCPGCVSDNPGNGMPSHIIVHDTEISNIYMLRESDLNDGAEDIRYHYLINQKGLIFEGLEGGPNKSADHFNCMNGHTISIGFLGDFDIETPTTQALNSFDLLLEYLCSEYLINPEGVADHVFYDFENNDWGVNVDMPQVSLHSIVGFYPEHACDLDEVGNCPGINFPALEETLLPFVQYCPASSQHVAIELAADIEIDVSGSEKSNNRDVLLSTEVLSLNTALVINLRAILCKDLDTLLIQNLSNVIIAEEVNTLIDFENNFALEEGLYEAVVQYQTSDTSMWVSLSSELYENEIDVTIGNVDIDNLNMRKVTKNYLLYPNPQSANNTQIHLDFEDQNPVRYLEIYNNLGQKIITKKAIKKQNSFAIALSPGVYILKITEDRDVFTEKLIVY